jgi:hypothetical protein
VESSSFTFTYPCRANDCAVLLKTGCEEDEVFDNRAVVNELLTGGSFDTCGTSAPSAFFGACAHPMKQNTTADNKKLPLFISPIVKTPTKKIN